VAEPVLLISSDPSLVAGLRAMARGAPRGCLRQLGRDAYLRFPDPVQRRRYHQAVVGAVATRLLGGRDPLATARLLGAAGPRRNLQVYAVDAGLQRLLAGLRLDGSLADGDYVAVHALNRNRSRVDLFQRRLVRQVVRLAGDGSAEVSRVVKVINAVPAGERGRPLLRVQVDLAAGRSAILTVGYRLGQALTRHDGGWRYRLAADPEALAEPPALRVEVVAHRPWPSTRPPAGPSAATPPAWPGPSSTRWPSSSTCTVDSPRRLFATVARNDSPPLPQR
jgi:hypothetical protein